MSITFRAASTPTNQSNSTAAVSLPTGTTTGDVTIIVSAQAQASNVAVAKTATVPAGWTAVFNTPGFLVCYRAYQAGDPTSVTITWSGANWTTTTAVTYTGCDTANPVDTSAQCIIANVGAAAAPLRAPSVAPNFASGQLVCVYGYTTISGGVALTLPGSLTSRSASTAGPSVTIADQAGGATNAPTGNLDASTASNTGYASLGCQILLKANGAASLTRAANFISTAGLLGGPTATAATVTTYSLAELGVQVGDLVMLSIASQATTVTPPAGWTTLQTSVDGLLCYRVNQSGDTSTPVITLSSSASTCYDIVAVRPAYPLTSGALAIDTSGQTTAASATTVATPNLTPATTSEFLALFAVSKGGGGGTWSISAGPTRDLRNAGATSAQFAWEQPSANPSGSFTWTCTTSQTTLTAWAALARLPAPVVPPTQPLQMIIT